MHTAAKKGLSVSCENSVPEGALLLAERCFASSRCGVVGSISWAEAQVQKFEGNNVR